MTTAIDTMREALEALEHDREAFIDHLSPDFEGVVLPEVSAEPDSYSGHEGVRRYFDLFDDVVDDLRFVAGDMEQVGDWVLADVQITGSGRSSGAPVEMGVVMAVLVEDGRITRILGQPDREAARAAIA
jgi:ketosteroid isomerase-like protein